MKNTKEYKSMLEKLKADGNEAVKSVEAEDKKGLFGKLFKK